MEGGSIKQTTSAGGVVLNQKGQVLVVNQKGISWSLPKGHIENGEDPIDTAQREIREESGIAKLELIKNLGSYNRYRIGKNGGENKTELKTIIMYLFRTEENNLKPIDQENPEARWIKKEQVAELLTHSRDKEFFLQIKKEI